MRQAADDWQPRRAASGSGAAGANASAAGTAAAQHSATTALRMLKTRSEEAEHELGCWQNEKSLAKRKDDEQTTFVKRFWLKKPPKFDDQTRPGDLAEYRV